MPAHSDQNAPEKPTNLSINSDLPKNSNQVQQWLDQNRGIIAAYNKAVDENGGLAGDFEVFKYREVVTLICIVSALLYFSQY